MTYIAQMEVDGKPDGYPKSVSADSIEDAVRKFAHEQSAAHGWAVLISEAFGSGVRRFHLRTRLKYIITEDKP